MYNIKIIKIFKSYIHFFALVLLIFISILSTNYYLNYKYKQIEFLEKIGQNIYFKKTIYSILDNIKPRYREVNIKVKIGDNYEKILSNLDLPKIERNKILNSIKKIKSLKSLKKGQKISFKIDSKKPETVLEFYIETSNTKQVKFTKNIYENKFNFIEIEKNLKLKKIYREAKITSSLYSSAIEAGVPPNVIVDFARIYGFQIDFQRDIWKNDTFQIIYEIYIDENKKRMDTGNIIYANLNLQGRDYPLYIYKYKKNYDHFDEDGKSIKKSLMKTPINGARLSSGFGMRKHPILGFNKMHKGTDFAAKEGTPVMASGDGKVIRSRWCGGGGNCIKIKHNSTYTTVYAHLSKFARGIKEGARVKQGQIIGYVGSTGLSTGPHLHYEVIENGKKINSQTLKLPSGVVLKKKQRKLFEIEKIKIDVLKSELIAQKN